MQPKTDTYYGTKMKSEADSPELPHDSRVKVTIVARPLLTPVAQKLCRGAPSAFTGRMFVRFRTLFRIEIVSCLSLSI
jgi:hypothetical protein